SPVLYSREGTVDKVVRRIRELGQQGVQFATFPETVVPYYPYFSFVQPPVQNIAGPEQPKLLDQAVTVPSLAGGDARAEQPYVGFKGGAPMSKMKFVQVPKAGADLEMVEREIPQPPAGHVRIRVLACGICHSDSYTKDGLFPGMTYPRVPGHEVAGVVDE